MELASLLVFAVGAAMVLFSFGSAIREFMIPGSDGRLLARVVVRATQWAFFAAARVPRSEAGRTAVLGFFAPVSLLLIYATLLLFNFVGFALMFHALGPRTAAEAVVVSGSAISTIGFARVADVPSALLSTAEALLTTSMVALLIGYLPTITSAYLERERAIAALEAQIGPIDSGVGLLEEYARAAELDRLDELWQEWTRWFGTLGRSRGSLAGTLFLRAPGSGRSWPSAAGTVLDAAALASSIVAAADTRQADRCLRAGDAALRDIASALALRHAKIGADAAPAAITRAQFDAACDRLAAAGTPLIADRDAAWAAFRHARAGYETALQAVGRLTREPTAAWAERGEEARRRGAEP